MRLCHLFEYCLPLCKRLRCQWNILLFVQMVMALVREGNLSRRLDLSQKCAQAWPVDRAWRVIPILDVVFGVYRNELLRLDAN